MTILLNELIEIGHKHLLMNPLHPFELCFNPVPIRFDTLNLYTSALVHEVYGMVHRLVL